MRAAADAQEREAILQDLGSPDDETRRQAVEQLVLLPVAEVTPYLSSALGDEAWRVRKAAVERIVACREDECVREMLIASLADGENPGRRNSAFEALVACGERMTDRLVGELGSPDVDVRKLVVDALAAIGSPAARGPLRAALGDVDANVRAAICEALGIVGGAGEAEDLLRVAVDADEDVLVRFSSLTAIARMRVSVEIDSLDASLSEVLLRPAAFEVLGWAEDERATDLLLAGLKVGSRSSREAAIAALVRRLSARDGAESEALRDRIAAAAYDADGLIDDACERLESANLSRRLVLLQFLGLLGDDRVVLPILRAGRDPAMAELADATLEALGAPVPAALARVWSDLDVDLRMRACDVLGRIGVPPADLLLGEVLSSEDVDLRCQAATAIGRAGFFDRLPDLVRQLEAAARSDDLEVEEEIDALVAAIASLAERPDASETGVDVQLIEVLTSRLAGAPEPVRLAIAQVLARLGREQDEDVIGYLLKDEAPGVRRAAVAALARFDFGRARDALRLALGDEAATVRIAGARVLGDSGEPEASEDLRQLIADDDPRVIAAAIRSLGRLHRLVIGPTAEVEALIERILGGDPMVALAALDALTEVGGARAGAIVMPVLERPEPEVVRGALSCLGLHGSEVELAAAIPLVSHEDWSVRAEVVQILAARRLRRALPAIMRRLEVEDDSFVREAILASIRELGE